MNTPIQSSPFYVKTACILVTAIALGYLAILGKEILSPLVFAALFAILLLRIAGFFERTCRLPRGIACLLTVLIFLAANAGVFYLVGAQIGGLASDWPQFKEQLASSGKDFQHWLSVKMHINMSKQVNYINTASSNFLASSTAVIGVTLVSVSSMLLFLLFTLVYTFFFLLYRRLIMKFFVSVFQKGNTDLVHDIMEQVQHIIRKYIVGLLIELVTVSSVLCIAFSILGIQYAILLGLLGGLFNVIPYLGIFTALVVSSLITFATAGAASKVLLVIIVLVSTHLVDANVLFPWIVGSKVRINALAMIAGVVVGGLIWGIAGMFLSIPVIAVLKIICDRLEPLQPWGILLGADDKVPVKLPGTSSGATVQAPVS